MKTPATVLAALLAFACSPDEASLGGDEGGPGQPGGPDTGGGDHTGPDNAVGCPSVRADVSAQIPTVVFLVDRSGSMDEDFTQVSRWEAVYDSLMGQNGIIGAYQDRVRFGMALYSNTEGTSTCPEIEQIAPAMGNYAAIDNRYATLDPLDNTPTAESLNAIAPALAADSSPGPKAIIVATDGLPDTCAVPNPDGQPEARAMAVAAARGAHELGIETYMISVGPDVTDEHMQEMANAGIGLAQSSPAQAPFWRALSPIDLENAIDGVVAGIQGCDFELDGAVLPGGTGVVTLDGQELALGSQWELLGNNTIRLLGAACETMKDGGDHTVEAIFTCTGDENEPGDCTIDDDCTGDDVCNNGTCVPPSGPVFPPVE